MNGLKNIDNINIDDLYNEIVDRIEKAKRNVALKVNEELNDTSAIEVGYNFSKYDGHNPNIEYNVVNPIDKKTNNLYAKYDWAINNNDQGYLNIYRNKYECNFQGGYEEKTVGTYFGSNHGFSSSCICR